MIDANYRLSEQDLIRVPTSSGYIAYPLLDLLNLNGGMLRSTSNFGMPPVRFITQRGPFEDGETVLDLRYDTRVIQVFLARYLCNRVNLWSERNQLLDYIRPSRSFNPNIAEVVQPLIYRHYMPGGKIERGADMVTSAGMARVTSASGQFLHFGGLQVGDRFELTSGADAGVYSIAAVPNDYTLTLDSVLTADATNVQWRYQRGRAVRDLYVLVEQGPTFDERVDVNQVPTGYREVVRFIAHKPFWFGVEQSETWQLPDSERDLIFNGAGAYFGPAGSGRWVFSPTFVGETIDVTYWGTEPAKPIIIIDGPAELPTIENSTINVRLELDYNVSAGETVSIDTLALTVSNGAGENLYPFLSGDLATFQLSPRPQAPNRINQIAIDFAGAVAGSSNARLTWVNQYTGI